MVCDKLIEFFHKKFAPCGVIWLFCSLIVDSVFTIFIGMDGEISDINCFLPKDSLEAYKNQVDRACLSRYKKFHEPVLPLRWLSTISTVWYAVITIFYVVIVHHRVQSIDEQLNEMGNGFVDVTSYDEPDEKFVLFSYFCHHLLCSVFGIILTGLQYPIFHHNGFSKDFACTLSPELQLSIMNGQNSSYMNLTSAPIHCESASAGPYKILSICLSVVNIFLAVLLLVDLIHVLFKLKPYFKKNISLDFILVAKLFLGKNLRGGTNGEDGSSENNPAGASGTNGEHGSSQNNCTEGGSSRNNHTGAIGTSGEDGSCKNKHAYPVEISSENESFCTPPGSPTIPFSV